MRRWALVFGLVSCKGGDVEETDTVGSTDEADTDTDTDADSDADTDADTDTHTGPVLPPASYLGVCDVDVSGADEVPTRVVYEDLVGDPKLTLEPGAFILPLPNLASYALFAFGAGIETLVDPYAIDFETEYGVAVTYAPDTSCGVSLGQVEAWDVLGKTHVAVRLIDESYACEDTTCGPGPKAVVILAVPQGSSLEPIDLTGCLGVGGGCGQEPR